MVALTVKICYGEQLSFVRVPSGLLHPHVYSTPLRIEWIDIKPHIAFVSARIHSQSTTCIEIPDKLAKALGVQDSVLCDVSVVLDCIPDARVFVEPVTEQDWDRIELNAQQVEQSMLAQIDMITRNKPFPLFVQGNAICYLKCEMMERKRGFVRLANHTEIVVASKSGKLGKSENFKEVELRVQSEETLLESEKSELENSFVAYVHPKCFDLLGLKSGNLVVVRALKDHPHVKVEQFVQNQAQIDRQNDEHSNNGSVLRILTSTSVHLNHISICKNVRERIGVQVSCYVLLSNAHRRSAIHKSEVEGIILQPLYFIPRHLESIVDYSSSSLIKSCFDLNVKEEFLDALRNVQVNYSILNFTLEDCLIPIYDGMIIEIQNSDREEKRRSVYVSVHIQGSQVPQNQPKTSSDNQVHILKPIVYHLIDPDLINDSVILVKEEFQLMNYRHDPLIGQISLFEMGGVGKHFENMKVFLSPILCSDFEISCDLKEILLKNSSLLLITGASGTGKTTLSKGIAKYFREISNCLAHVIYIPCRSLINEKLRDLEQLFTDIVMEAERHETSLVVFDDLDKLISSKSDHDLHHNLRCSKLAEKLSDLINECRRHCYLKKSTKVSFLACTRDKSSLHADLKLPELFSFEVSLGVPDASCRLDMIMSMIESTKEVNLATNVDLERIQSHLEGCVASDLKTFVDRTIHYHLKKRLDDSNNEGRDYIDLDEDDFYHALKGFSASSLKSLQLQSSEVSWNDIGGLEGVQNILKETLESPSRYSLLFSQIPLKLRSGVLLYGPPGCGKTMIASAVAKECGLNFISVKGPELLNKYIGASEQAVRDVFQRAAAASPCVVFFDEFDAIAPRRGGDSTGVTDRVVNQLLCHLDGVENRTGVYVLAASSRPDLIDPALLRPGRLDKSLHCPLPDFESRKSIMNLISRKIRLDQSISIETLAQRTEFYSGADIQGLFTSAQILAVHDAVNQAKSNFQEEEDRQIVIQCTHMEQALSSSRISISESERLRYESIHQRISGTQSISIPKDQKVILK